MKSFVRVIVFGVAAAGCVATALVACGSDTGGTLNCGPGTMQVGTTCVVVSADGAPLDGTLADGSPGNDVVTETGSDAGVDTGPPNRCPFGKGPIMAELPKPDGGGTFCIDTTEVTESQYDAFVFDLGPNPSGDPKCPGIGTYKPYDKNNGSCGNFTYDPMGHPSDPIVCIPYCHAFRYCKWAGKRLCGAYVQTGSSVLTNSDKTEASWACQNGGKSPYPYGTQFVPGRCVDYQLDGGDGQQIARPVRSAPQCRGILAPYSSVYDVAGNVVEWQGVCNNTNECLGFGGSFVNYQVTDDCLGGGSLSLFKDFYQEDVGFRCCAD